MGRKGRGRLVPRRMSCEEQEGTPHALPLPKYLSREKREKKRDPIFRTSLAFVSRGVVVVVASRLFYRSPRDGAVSSPCGHRFLLGVSSGRSRRRANCDVLTCGSRRCWSHVTVRMCVIVDVPVENGDFGLPLGHYPESINRIPDGLYFLTTHSKCTPSSASDL